MKIANRGTHLIDIDFTQGKQVLDNLSLPVVGSERQEGLCNGQELRQTIPTNVRFSLLGDAAV